MRGWLRFVVPDRGGNLGDAEDAPPISGRAWRATVVGLHLAFVVVIVIGALSVLPWSGQTDSSVNAAWPVGALAVLALAYATAGAPALGSDAPVRAVAYLSVLVVVLGVVAATAPSALFVLFLAYPQVWFLVERNRPGVLWTLLLGASSTAGLALQVHRVGGSSVAAAGDMTLGLLFSLMMGTWVGRVLQQSRERGRLISELSRTRDDLAASHHSQGVMAERERLAREVHDTLAQGWTSIVVLARIAANEMDADPAKARERLSLIEEVARDNLRETRVVVAAFAPSELDGSTLVEALERLAARFQRETGVATRLDTASMDAQASIGRDQEVVLLRASQEALSNARRHAHASLVTLALVCNGDRVGVVVSDDGAGFDPVGAVGSGLAGLRQRLEQAGGVLDVTSRPGGGTTVEARLSTAAAVPR